MPAVPQLRRPTRRLGRVATSAVVRRRVRMRGPFRAALAVAVLCGVAALIGPPIRHYFDHHATYAPSQQQVAAAQRFVSQLPTPAGAVRDPYSTACLAANTNLCLTSTTRSPDALFHDVVGQLGARGAAVKSESCGKPVDVIARCLADVRFSGVQLVVTGDATAGAKAALGVLVNDPNMQPSTTVAMGSWASLGIVPEGWRGTATCVSKGAGGCVRYSATLSVAGNLASAGKAFQTSLSAAHFRVLSASGCPAGGSDRCLVRADRYLKPEGVGLAVAQVSLQSLTPTSLRATVYVMSY